MMAQIALLLSVASPPVDPMPLHRYMRALSLDLRGSLPEPAEYEAVESEADLDSILDDWLASEAFTDQVVRRHRQLLFNNIGNLALTTGSVALRASPEGVLFAALRSNIWRITPEAPCLDEPAEFAPDGTILAKPGTWQGLPVLQEGYVLVSPYFAPDKVAKVCAYDAQEALVSPTGYPCDTIDGLRDYGCGCGPNLRWCHHGGPFTDVGNALGRDLDLRIAAVIGGDRPYTELFTSQRAFVNGQIVYYYRNIADVPGALDFEPLSVDVTTLPDLGWEDSGTWTEIQLPPEHAGILTSPAFLLRFQTNRARANRFHLSFLCQPFQLPAGGLVLEDDTNLEPNLQARPGCKYCHAALEPSATYFGRWGEAGAGYLDPVSYPLVRQDCALCASVSMGCSSDCTHHYLTGALAASEVPFLGHFRPSVFVRPEHLARLEQGPRQLALAAIADGRLPRCSAIKAFEWLMGRAPESSDGAVIEAATAAFVRTGYRYRALVKAIVANDAYRNVR